jgi:hypothetical protein
MAVSDRSYHETIGPRPAAQRVLCRVSSPAPYRRLCGYGRRQKLRSARLTKFEIGDATASDDPDRNHLEGIRLSRLRSHGSTPDAYRVDSLIARSDSPQSFEILPPTRSVSAPANPFSSLDYRTVQPQRSARMECVR